jgi:uncharacterized protein (TIGR02246 family)
VDFARFYPTAVFSGISILKHREETMKMRLITIAALVGIVSPAFTQTPDAKLRQAVETIDKKFVDAQDKGDAAALAAVFSDDAVMVTNIGPLNGRKAIEEYYANAFKTTQFSNTTSTIDPDSPRSISATAMWVTGSWSTIAKGANWGPVEIKGFWGSIKTLEGGTWKILTESWNITPPPAAAAAPSPTTTPSNQ